MSSSIHYDPAEAESNPFASDAPSPALSSQGDVSHESIQSPPPPPHDFQDTAAAAENDDNSRPIIENPYSQDNSSTVIASEEQSQQEHQTAQDQQQPLPSQQEQEQQQQLQAQQQQQHSDVSSTTTRASSSKVKKYKLITKVTGLERQGKKDPIIRFDAYTTLPRFRTTTFKDIRRTHNEFVKFFEHLNGNNPECFVPSVPAALTSAGAGTEEDETKVKYKMQLWLDRVTSNPILARDEEFVYFIEADFGYRPVVKKRPPATGLTRKAMKQFAPPHDETELAEFRPLVKQVFLSASETGAKLDKVTKHRRSLGLSMNDFGSKAGAMGDLDENLGMINMWRKLGKVIMTLGDLDSIKATNEAASLGDGINWVAQDAYVAKEAMTNRHLLMKELIKAQSTTKSKHQTAVRVKGSSNLSPVKVDEAITALTDATQHEERLTNKVRRVTDNMLLEKNTLLSHFENDIKSYIGEYVLRMIESERRALNIWESVRLDVRAADSNGGLSRLGRESTPANRRAVLAASQGPKGDSWSGDRRDRAPDYHVDDTLKKHPEIEKEQDDEDNELADDSEETAVDARNAASLLAGSTF